MFRKLREVYRLDKRTYKNFGHKREPEPLFTVLWHGFLTFSFIGMGIEWKRMYRFFFDEEPERSSLTDLE
ncbi:unnamed protein product [Pieris brassicae]|uniref:Uncharacterized protein n=1 Tax=Pieris brassicae TaxID=7116 RepID=A0A9P0TC51_PIEBR|nr:unnamed protein product [Pieris brassicae]